MSKFWYKLCGDVRKLNESLMKDLTDRMKELEKLRSEYERINGVGDHPDEMGCHPQALYGNECSNNGTISQTVESFTKSLYTKDEWIVILLYCDEQDKHAVLNKQLDDVLEDILKYKQCVEVEQFVVIDPKFFDWSRVVSSDVGFFGYRENKHISECV